MMSAALPIILLESATYISYLARTNASLYITNILHIDSDTLHTLMCIITISCIVVAINKNVFIDIIKTTILIRRPDIMNGGICARFECTIL
jgi:hypothetical protein